VLRVVITALLALSFTLATFEAVAERSDSRRFPPPGKLVDVGGHKMHINCQGEGSPTVVFESGAGSTSLSWSLVQPEVAKFTRTCAYDRAGLGWSEPGPRPRTIMRAAQELHAVLESAGVKPPYLLVAHSLGGAIAMDFASRHPDDVAGFVFVDAAYKELYEEYVERFPNWWGRIQRSKWFLRAARASAYVALPRLARINMGNSKLSTHDLAAANALGRRPSFFRTVADEIRGLELSRESARSAPPLDRPVVVLSHSDADALFKEAEADRLWQELQGELANRFESATHRLVEASGHFIQLDRPTEVIDEIHSTVLKVREDSH
jgi:pimeloyl-ACP methyl ester carboxylesterase